MADRRHQDFRLEPLDPRLVLHGMRLEKGVLRGRNVRDLCFRLEHGGCEVILFGRVRIFVPGVSRVEIDGYETERGMNAFRKMARYLPGGPRLPVRGRPPGFTRPVSRGAA